MGKLPAVKMYNQHDIPKPLHIKCSLNHSVIYVSLITIAIMPSQPFLIIYCILHDKTSKP